MGAREIFIIIIIIYQGRTVAAILPAVRALALVCVAGVVYIGLNKIYFIYNNTLTKERLGRVTSKITYISKARVLHN